MFGPAGAVVVSHRGARLQEARKLAGILAVLVNAQRERRQATFGLVARLHAWACSRCRWLVAAPVRRRMIAPEDTATLPRELHAYDVDNENLVRPRANAL